MDRSQLVSHVLRCTAKLKEVERRVSSAQSEACIIRNEIESLKAQFEATVGQNIRERVFRAENGTILVRYTASTTSTPARAEVTIFDAEGRRI